ncbi:hypothetical protein D3C81_2043500 [compost metagenome]
MLSYTQYGSCFISVAGADGGLKFFLLQSRFRQASADAASALARCLSSGEASVLWAGKVAIVDKI